MAIIDRVILWARSKIDYSTGVTEYRLVRSALDDLIGDNPDLNCEEFIAAVEANRKQVEEELIKRRLLKC